VLSLETRRLALWGWLIAVIVLALLGNR